MGIKLLIQLSENDKRIIIAVCLILILLFVLIGLIGSLIVRTMKWQGKKCDTLVSDVVTNHIVETPSHLRRYARKKNIRYFIKQAWIPIILIAVGFLILLLRAIIKQDWAYNPFNIDDGFGTLLFIWDFENPDYYTTIFGIKVLAEWPGLTNSPHFVVEGLFAYTSLPLIGVGAIWYLVVAQAYLARTIRAIKLSKQVFEKSLDGFNQNTPIQQNINPQVDNNEINK